MKTENAVVIEVENPVLAIVSEYSNEMSERDERVMKNTLALLTKHKVNDEMTRARVIYKKKAFIADLFCELVESGKL